VADDHHFLLQRVQPAMVGLIDGSLSTLAPIFSVALVSHKPLYAFAAEGLSDTGELTGRGSPIKRGAITGAGTFFGGILHTLPFLWPNYHAAIITAVIVVAFELVGLAWIRWKFFNTSFVKSLGLVSVAGAVIAIVGALVGAGV
jgi:VIT1/CCC1 family predicted Fe2+/Mn2+ transporter